MREKRPTKAILRIVQRAWRGQHEFGEPGNVRRDVCWQRREVLFEVPLPSPSVKAYNVRPIPAIMLNHTACVAELPQAIPIGSGRCQLSWHCLAFGQGGGLGQDNLRFPIVVTFSHPQEFILYKEFLACHPAGVHNFATRLSRSIPVDSCDGCPIARLGCEHRPVATCSNRPEGASLQSSLCNITSQGELALPFMIIQESRCAAQATYHLVCGIIFGCHDSERLSRWWKSI